MKKNNIIVVIVIVLLGIIIFMIATRPINEVTSFDDSKLRNSIKFKDSLITIYKKKISDLTLNLVVISKQRDSLVNVKKKIIKNHVKQKRFINSSDIFVTDSIIRANL